MKEPSADGYFKFMSDQLKEAGIPEEVFGVAMLQRYNCVVGSTVYAECQKIIEKYPQHFPWEARHRAIPKEVHEAYAKEAWGGLFGGDRSLKISQYPEFKENDGIVGAMAAQGVPLPIKEKSEPGDFKQAFDDMLNTLENNRKRREEEKMKAKEIWDKHYKKYNLPYRE